MTEWISRLFPDSPRWVHFWNTVELGRDGAFTWVAGFALLVLLASWIYRRDSVGLGWGWKLWLVSLRVAVLLALLVVALVPQERDSRIISQPSRVALLVDSSLSMGIRDRSSGQSAAAADQPTRAAEVVALLGKSPLIETLRATHDITVYTFDSKLAKQQLLEKHPVELPGSPPPLAGTAPQAPPATAVWEEWTRPRGLETRLGESLLELVRQEAGDTLSGVVLITDGGSNAGVDAANAADAAVAAKVRLFPVGVGSTTKPVNLQLAEVQCPSHVHLGDGFSLTAFVSAQGLSGKVVQVELLSKPEQDEGPPSPLETREVTLGEDGVPMSVTFDYTPTEAGRRQFFVRAKPVNPVQELVVEDNEDRAAVEVIDRQTKVLLLAGGPMRDYQFVRNLLHRDKSIELDVLLQSGGAGISQESDNLLSVFPETREELFNYDVIIAFDPNWRQIGGTDGTAFQILSEWVFSHAGGLILVAGEVNTPQLATAPEPVKRALERVLELYPVFLDARGGEVEGDEYQQAWPIEFTREGQEAGFLQLTDNPATSVATWKEFQGFFRCYPSDGAKAGATIYARFTDPRSADDKPVLMASQYFGAGRVFYLGSAETWRLRALDEDFYDRLWIKLVREVGQGRLLRGTNRGILLLEKRSYPLGATVPVRARLLDPQFKDYIAEKVPLDVIAPGGKPLPQAVELIADKTRPGHYSGAFVAIVPGNFSLELPVPESKDFVKSSISVKLPNLEYDHPEQNEQLLKALVRGGDAGGRYLRLEEAAAELPSLLPDRTVQKVQFDFPRTLWDRQWVMYVLVGLLSLEWLTRKLLKLA